MKKLFIHDYEENLNACRVGVGVMREASLTVEQDNDIIVPQLPMSLHGIRARTRGLYREEIYDPVSGVTITIWSALGAGVPARSRLN
jgi:hypothetical protein